MLLSPGENVFFDKPVSGIGQRYSADTSPAFKRAARRGAGLYRLRCWKNDHFCGCLGYLANNARKYLCASKWFRMSLATW